MSDEQVYFVGGPWHAQRRAVPHNWFQVFARNPLGGSVEYRIERFRANKTEWHIGVVLDLTIEQAMQLILDGFCAPPVTNERK